MNERTQIPETISGSTHRPGGAGVPEIIERVARQTSTVAMIIGGAAVALLAINLILDISMRTLANRPINGTIEMVTFWWMVPLVFFGLAVAQRNREHTDLPILYDQVNGPARTVIGLISVLATAVLVALIGWYGWQNAVTQMSVGEYASATGVTLWPARFAVPLGALAFLLELLAQAARQISAPRPDSGGENLETRSPEEALG